MTDGAKRDDVYPHALKENDVLQRCITDELLKLKIEKKHKLNLSDLSLKTRKVS